MRRVSAISVGVVLFLSGFLMNSCKSQFEALLESPLTEEKYKAAFELFEKKKYSKAEPDVTTFRSFCEEIPSTFNCCFV